jgi:putative membrane protein
MQFLKILFWCLLAFLAALFTLGNWTNVQIKLWGGLIAEINLPLLLLATFLLGLLPMLLYHHTVRWRLRQRLATAQGTVETLRTPAYVPPTAPLKPDPDPAPPAILTVVPPGGA